MSDTAPAFTDEQRAWLADMLTPRCCHTTGEHNPNHFADQAYVCTLQEAERYLQLRKALDLPLIQNGRGWPSVPASEAISKPGCFWCDPERAK